MVFCLSPTHTTTTTTEVSATNIWALGRERGLGPKVSSPPLPHFCFLNWGFHLVSPNGPGSSSGKAAKARCPSLGFQQLPPPIPGLHQAQSLPSTPSKQWDLQGDPQLPKTHELKLSGSLCRSLSEVLPWHGSSFPSLSPSLPPLCSYSICCSSWLGSPSVGTAGKENRRDYFYPEMLPRGRRGHHLTGKLQGGQKAAGDPGSPLEVVVHEG